MEPVSNQVFPDNLCPRCQADYRLNVAVIGEEVGVPDESLQGISERVAEIRLQNTRMARLLRSIVNGDEDAIGEARELLEERALLAQFAAIDRMYR